MKGFLDLARTQQNLLFYTMFDAASTHFTNARTVSDPGLGKVYLKRGEQLLELIEELITQLDIDTRGRMRVLAIRHEAAVYEIHGSIETSVVDDENC
ncbi:MAG TPA: hypothetical protein VN861_14715 [Candidatus Acidoferrales bacterium]|nr:hypothetical protein [Candidatus Acidoferrales bacterium]